MPCTAARSSVASSTCLLAPAAIFCSAWSSTLARAAPSAGRLPDAPTSTPPQNITTPTTTTAVPVRARMRALAISVAALLDMLGVYGPSPAVPARKRRLWAQPGRRVPRAAGSR